jgi:hypothetical protein
VEERIVVFHLIIPRLDRGMMRRRNNSGIADELPIFLSVLI